MNIPPICWSLALGIIPLTHTMQSPHAIATARTALIAPALAPYTSTHHQQPLYSVHTQCTLPSARHALNHYEKAFKARTALIIKEKVRNRRYQDESNPLTRAQKNRPSPEQIQKPFLSYNVLATLYALAMLNEDPQIRQNKVKDVTKRLGTLIATEIQYDDHYRALLIPLTALDPSFPHAKKLSCTYATYKKWGIRQNDFRELRFKIESHLIKTKNPAFDPLGRTHHPLYQLILNNLEIVE